MKIKKILSYGYIIGISLVCELGSLEAMETAGETTGVSILSMKSTKVPTVFEFSERPPEICKAITERAELVRKNKIEENWPNPYRQGKNIYNNTLLDFTKLLKNNFTFMDLGAGYGVQSQALARAMTDRISEFPEGGTFINLNGEDSAPNGVIEFSKDIKVINMPAIKLEEIGKNPGLFPYFNQVDMMVSFNTLLHLVDPLVDWVNWHNCFLKVNGIMEMNSWNIELRQGYKGAYCYKARLLSLLKSTGEPFVFVPTYNCIYPEAGKFILKRTKAEPLRIPVTYVEIKDDHAIYDTPLSSDINISDGKKVVKKIDFLRGDFDEQIREEYLPNILQERESVLGGFDDEDLDKFFGQCKDEEFSKKLELYDITDILKPEFDPRTTRPKYVAFGYDIDFLKELREKRLFTESSPYSEMLYKAEPQIQEDGSYELVLL